LCEVGLKSSCDYRARYYEPNSGRFVSEDPLAFKGGDNFYSYVENNSINAVDPYGLASCLYSISAHTMVCQGNGNGQPALIGPNAVRVGPNGVASGKGICLNNPRTGCLKATNEGPIVPATYKINRDTRTPNDGHDRFRLEPTPNDFLSRMERKLSRARNGFQLHRGHVSLGCINVNQDDPAAMKDYDALFTLLVQENGSNTLTVVP
jgi:hypothetical protein